MGLGQDLGDLDEIGSLGSEASGVDDLEGIDNLDDEGGGSSGGNQQSFRIYVDSAPLRRVPGELRELSRAIVEELDKSLREVAEDIAEKSRGRARAMPRKGPGTNRMEGSIRVLGAGKTLRVVGGGAKAPELAPIDGAAGGSFRHPVFGNQDVWVSQRGFRIITPGDEEAAEVEAAGLAAMDRAIRKTGWA